MVQQINYEFIENRHLECVVENGFLLFAPFALGYDLIPWSS